MHTTSARVARSLAPLGALLLLLAACTSSAGAAGWTYAPPIATPSGSAAASGGASANPSGSGTASGSPGGTVIELKETADLKITDTNGQQVTEILVKKGQTYTFRITNTAGFDHNFNVGKPDDLQAGNTANLTGIPNFSSGTREFQYTFAQDGPLGFGCTIPGHYSTMKGTFTIQP